MAKTIVRPTQNLARAARELGDGQLDAAVEPQGPVELVELAGAFNDLGSQVSSMLDRERELVAELSHRLRTPLTKLRLRLDQVNDDELAAELRHDVDDVTGVVNDLIHEARGTLAVEPGCDLGVVVTERAEFWSVLAEDQERDWRFEHGGGDLEVKVSRADLAAAVDVLLENVFAHTPEGAPLTIGFGRSDASVDQLMAKLWVSDGGGGIGSGSLERGESSMGSTGLGLAIARRLAEEAGGRFEIGTSSLGGAQVTISLPLLAGSAD
jgi:signal transduction histidine kinase